MRLHRQDRAGKPAPQGEVVVVVGASSGIGRASAVALARRGDTVVLAARSPEALAEAAAQCRTGSGEVLVVPTDVTDPAAVDSLLVTAAERFGRVDAVVHSAGVVAYGHFADIPADVFDRVVTTNLTGTANVARSALAQFAVQRGGHLVLVGSVLGQIVTPYMSPYIASKWGMHGLARALQVEARRLPGVRVALVLPGSVDTPMYTQAANYLGRVGRPPPPVDSPEKVARAVVRAVRRPRRYVSVGIANPMMMLGFNLLPPVYDRLVLPLMRVGALSRQPVAPHPGNVWEPQPQGEAVHGSWVRHWLRPVGAGLAAAAALAVAAAVRVRVPQFRV